MIYEITPFASDKRYGRALNKMIECFPEDAWICVRDRDTMYLQHDAGRWMQEAIKDHPDTVLFTCSTNRVFGKALNQNSDIKHHIEEAARRAQKKHYSYITGVVPAFFWLFPRRVWQANKFDDHKIVHNNQSFDARWTRSLRGTKRVIEHLYVWHTYRIDRHHRDFQHLK